MTSIFSIIYAQNVWFLASSQLSVDGPKPTHLECLLLNYVLYLVCAVNISYSNNNYNTVIFKFIFLGQNLVPHLPNLCM